MEWVAFVLITGVCTLILAAIGLWALFRETPMHFWAGDTVDPATITDVKSYNKANARLWFGYCVPFAASMIAAPFSMIAAAIIMVAGAAGGLIVIIAVYGRIRRKYTR